MLKKKLWRTMALYKVQFISMIIMTTLGLGVFVGFHMEWYTLETRTQEYNEQTGMADYSIYANTSFTQEEARQIGDIEGVDAYSRFVSVVANVNNTSKDTVSLSVTENENVSGFIVTTGEKYNPQSTDGIWLSDLYAQANNIHVGDTFAVSVENVTIKGTVKGLIKSSEYTVCVRDASQLMPDYNTHGYAYISPAMYENAMPAAIYPSVHILSSMDESKLKAEAKDILGYQPNIFNKDTHVSYAGPQGEIDEGKTMATLLPIIFLTIAILSMVTTTHRIASQEKTQIGTLKALGFKNRQILRHYTSYAIIIGVIGSIAGLFFGYWLCGFFMDPQGPMGSYMDMPNWKLACPSFVLPTIIAIVVGLGIIGYQSCYKMLRGSAADALRPYVPQNVKPLAFEQTSWFSKLSFGTRWNLRDTFRHKARTAMSIFGVTSCVVIVLVCFGMQDTMTSYLNNSYYPSMNYESRIYLSQEATDKDRKELIGMYGSDTSSTLSVLINNDKSVALHIYHLEGDSVGFIGENAEPIELVDDGAYVCARIADEYGLEAGDKFSVSPYGTNDEYTLKVAGIARSTMEENVVISDAYAKKIGLNFTPDSIYTDVAANNIDQSPAISTVQSRESITSSFDSFIEIMDMTVVAFIAVGILLGIVVLYNLGIMTYTERYRELATLKVIGFRDKQLSRLLHGQSLSFTLVGIALGTPLGTWLLCVLMNELAAEYEMIPYIAPSTYVISAVITLGVSYLVNTMTSRKNRKIDMVAALKNAE